MAEEELTVNKRYADNYNQWRRKEELQKLKDRYGDQVTTETSSSSESEDEDASAWTEQNERDFFRTLSAVKFKDPKIYQKDVTFYHSEDPSSSSRDEDDNDEDKVNTKKDQPMYLKDYERKVLLEQDGKFEDEEDESDEEFLRSARAASPSYVEEQKILKDSFKAALASSDSDDENEIDTFLTKREKTKEELKQEEEDYIQWLKGQKDDDVKNTELSEMKPLKDYWTNPDLDKGEKFLRDYILNKGYRNKNDDRIPTYGEIVGDGQSDEDIREDFSEEERQLEKEEEFERKYNFRYEEPDSDFVKRYPRTIGESVRIQSNKRSAKRSEIKDRKTKEKEKIKEDLKQLKNLKKKEIIEKIEKLKQITGNTTVGFEDEDIDGDFDPVKYDQLMQNVFDNEYYAMESEDTKPEFHDDEVEDENWDAWEGEIEDNQYGYDAETEEYHDDYYDGPHCEDPDFNMDADYDPSKDPKKSKKKIIQEMMAMSKKKKRQSKFAEAVGREKPVFDPSSKSFEDYFDEYYKLDYEDIVDGQPCRFKYRQVVANDFGLSTDEILSAKERELNQWASLKKTCQYRPTEEELRDVNIFQKKANNHQKKERVFPSLYSEESEEAKKTNQKKRKHGSEESGSTNKDSQPSKKSKKQKSESESKDSTRHSEKEMLSRIQPSKKKQSPNAKPQLQPDKKIPAAEKSREPKRNSKRTVKRVDQKVAKRDFAATKKRKMRKMFLKPLLSNLRVKAYGINPWKLQYQTGQQSKAKSKQKKLKRGSKGNSASKQTE